MSAEPQEYYDELEKDDCCPECGGEGYVLDDCFEDTCCCADPEEHGYVKCSLCFGKGLK